MTEGERILEKEMPEPGQSERALRQSQERLRLTIAAADLGMWDWDIVSDQGVWSPRCLELFGLSPGTRVTYQRFLETIHPEDRDRIDQAIRTAMERHEDFDAEMRIVWPNGTVHYLAAGARAYYDPSGRLTRLIGFAKDITQHKLAERQLSQQAMLLDLAPFFVVDIDYHIVFWSRGMQMLYGWSGPEVLGKKSVELLQTSFSTPLEQIRDKLFRDGSWEGELVHTRKDGERITVACLLVLQRDASGQGISVMEVNNDIIQRRQAHEAVRESQERLSLAIATANLGMWDWDIVSDEGVWSPRSFDLFGISPGPRMTYQHFLETIHPEDRERVDRSIRAVVERHEDYEGELRIVLPNSTVRYIVSRGHANYDPLGRPTRMIGVAMDITARKQAEDALRAAKEELARANQELEEKVRQRTAKLQEAIGELQHMSYSMIHDMRAPLRSMQGFATLLEEDYTDSLKDQGLEYCRLIRQSATRLDHLVADALNYDNVVRQDFPLTPVEVGSLLRGMIETYPNLQEPEAHITIEFSELVVHGNPSSLTQCFGNLLGNAVKFVAPGVKPRVDVRAEAIGETVRIWVEDNGIGIPNDAQQRIFGLFQRVCHEGEYPGTGLGLAIVRKAVERMGGRLGLESEPGKGSRFWIELQMASF
ncbi:MAG: multi-sensor hybrid histidine kinase [Pedosphaera sp.]|nr:multi-sensor hybrid histidine kinase [Pedosphaera sp.]